MTGQELSRLISAHISPRDLLDHFNVSRESIARLELYVEELLKWQQRINLISSSTIDSVWHRHICDGLQLAHYIRADNKLILDIGSGAGIPGIPLAIALMDTHPGTRVIMVESNAKKAAFLKHIIRVCELDSRIVNSRVESLTDSDVQQTIDVCSARALAPLPVLFGLMEALPSHPQRMLFYKGQDVDVELTEATKCWNTSFIKHPSRVDQAGCILEIRKVERVDTSRTSNP